MYSCYDIVSGIDWNLPFTDRFNFIDDLDGQMKKGYLCTPPQCISIQDLARMWGLIRIIKFMLPYVKRLGPTSVHMVQNLIKMVFRVVTAPFTYIKNRMSRARAAKAVANQVNGFISDNLANASTIAELAAQLDNLLQYTEELTKSLGVAFMMG